MNDAQLGSKLAACARGVDLTKALLPEPPANGKQRVIVDDHRAVAEPPRDFGKSATVVSILDDDEGCRW